MTNQTLDVSLRKIGRIVGLLFLLTLMIPILNWTLVFSKFIVPENAINTAHNIVNNEFLFRIGIINDLISSAVAIALAVGLYIILKSVNKNLAIFALFIKFMEAILWAIMTLGNYVNLLILKGQTSLTAGESGQIQTIVGLSLNAHMSKTAIAGVFLGLSSMIFFYLLFKSKLVPKILAGFGFISYTLIFFYDSITILLPNYSDILVIQMIAWGPSIIFQITIGFWLLIKGISVESIDNYTRESV